jgi:hypothetical protein
MCVAFTDSAYPFIQSFPRRRLLAKGDIGFAGANRDFARAEGTVPRRSSSYQFDRRFAPSHR